MIVSSAAMTAGDPGFKARLDSLATDLRAAGAAGVEPGPVSRDGHSALLLVELGPDVEPVVERVERADGADGFETLIVGEDSIEEDFSAAAEEDLARGELFGLALALLVLIVVFRGLVAAFVPVVVAVASIVVALAGVAAIGQAFVLNFVVVNVLVMMGLAVGIDYSLFVVSRFREERASGRAPGDAIAVAGSTASRAVLFSGATVVLALLGMFLVPHTVFRSIAVGAIAVVLVAVLAALTLLPATLSILGDRIERLRMPGRRSESGIWSRIAGVALRKPAVSLVAGAGVLIALAVPYASVDTGSAGVGTLPESFQTRAAYDAIEEAFGPQGTSAAEVVVKGDRTPQLTAAVAELRAAVEDDPAYGETAVAVAPGGKVTRVTVPVDADPAGPAATAAVTELRERYVPEAFAAASGAEVMVGGQTADEMDFAEVASDKAPLVFAFVLGLSFLVLVAAFRSLVIPLTAIATNLLSVGAAYGLLVLVFQHGDCQHDRVVAAAVPVHDPVRALDGLPRVPAEPDPRALAGDRGHARERRVRRAHDGAADHRGGADHGRGVRRVRRRPARDVPADGVRPRRRGADRRDARALGDRARRDGAAGPRELVAAAGRYAAGAPYGCRLGSRPSRPPPPVSPWCSRRSPRASARRR